MTNTDRTSTDMTVQSHTIRTPSQQILLTSLELLEQGDARGWVDLFSADGVLEFPYAPPGWPFRFQGHEALWAHMQKFPENLTVRFSGVTFYDTTDTDLAIAEFHADGTATATGRTLAQDYVSILWTENGQIVRYRDFWNPQRHLDALGGEAAAAAIVQA